MKNYTVSEMASKVGCSTTFIYDLIKNNKLQGHVKKEGCIRIPSTKLRLIKGFKGKPHNPEKVQLLNTSYGTIRKLKFSDEYVAVDLTNAIGLRSSHNLLNSANPNEKRKIDKSNSDEFGLPVGKNGLTLIKPDVIKRYSETSRAEVNWNKLFEELGIDKQLLFKECSKKELPNLAFNKEPKTGIQIFKNPEFGEIRALNINNEPYFVGKDAAERLGYTNPQKAIRAHVDEEDKGVNEMVTPGGTQEMIVINESGLYSLILSSKLPTAKKFKRWVTSEVLPTIRKTGGYVNNSEKFLDNYFSSFSPEIKQAMINDLEKTNESLFHEKNKVDRALLNNLNLIEEIKKSL